MGIRNDSNKFTIPGGHLKQNECYYEGMARELKEETGLDAKELKLVRMCKIDSKLLYLFKVEIDKEQKIDTSKDPDKECSIWFYLDPNTIIDQLHVSLEKNIALRYWANN